MANTSISSYLLRQLREGYATDEEDSFCFFMCGETLVRLTHPEKKDVGHFLALLHLLWRYQRLTGVFVRPFKLGQWLKYGVYIHPDINIVLPSSVTDNYALIKGWWTISSDSNYSQYLCVTDQITQDIQDQTDIFEDCPAWSDEKILRLDIHNYNPFMTEGTSYCFLLFVCDQEEMKASFLQVMSELNEHQKALIRDRQSLVEYIYSDINRNYIDIKDPININSDELVDWLALISDNPSEEEKEVGVFIFNRVIAFCKYKSRSEFAVKNWDYDTGKKELCISFWAYEKLLMFMKKFNFFSRIEEDPDEASEPKKKKRKMNTSQEGSSEKRREFSWFSLWIKNANRGECDGLIFKPWSLLNEQNNSYKNSEKFVNFRTIDEFQGYPVTLEQCKKAFMTSHGAKCIEYWKELIEQTLCGGNVTYFDFIHKWVASVVQHPERKTKVAVIFRSQMGMGKGFIGKVLSKWFGKHFYLLSGTSPAQKFNSFIHRKKIIFMDEVSSLVGELPILNSLITEETIAIEKKGIDQKNESNLAEFIGATNEEIKIRLGEDSRRWVIIEAPTKSTSERERWKKFMSMVYDAFFDHPVYKDTGVWALMFFYLKYDIKGFIPYLHIPRTEAVKKCIEYSMNITRHWWKYIIEKKQLEPMRDPGHTLDDTLYTWSNLFSKMRFDKEFENLLGARHIKMTENTFKLQLEEVASLNYQDGQQRFKFRPWIEQYNKWTEEVPDVALTPFKGDKDTLDTFTQNLIAQMKTVRPIPGLDQYTDQEKNYIITRLTEEVRKGKPVTFNQCFYLRKGSSVSNKDIIEFDYTLYFSFCFLSLPEGFSTRPNLIERWESVSSAPGKAGVFRCKSSFGSAFFRSALLPFSKI